MFIINLFGDIAERKDCKHATRKAFDDLEEALMYIKEHLFNKFDIEDDRIVVECISKTYKTRVVVWHCSGWHWEQVYTLSYGRGLEQGALPNHDLSMYDLLYKLYM